MHNDSDSNSQSSSKTIDSSPLLEGTNRKTTDNATADKNDDNNDTIFHDSFRSISTSSAWSTSLHAAAPLLTSQACAHALAHFFSHPTLLAVATEASSHPSGLASLFAQPYVYAGGGLGNLDECHAVTIANSDSTTSTLTSLQTCLAGAGGIQRDSLTFASVCMVPDCTALDLQADDFTATLARASQAAPAAQQAVAQDYVILLERSSELNRFLQTGWTCGEYVVSWNVFTTAPYVIIVALFVVAGLCGTLKCRRYRLQQQMQQVSVMMTTNTSKNTESSDPGDECIQDDNDDDSDGYDYDEEKKQDGALHDPIESASFFFVGSCAPQPPQSPLDCHVRKPHFLWSLFDLYVHVQQLTTQHSPETACLDGLRVGSLLWIMLGHVMAIVSSSGAGYSNPAEFLPPHGLTTTIPGQLLFSSRFAVDTFLCISGCLVVYVLDRKLPLQSPAMMMNGDHSCCSYATPRRLRHTVTGRYLNHLPSLVLSRVVRIFPTYLLTLGFYTQIAPHLGHGPFWYQWLALLQPCWHHGWTNILFVNNFVPWNTPITDTCFYHSWYLAVDMQLFLLAPLLVFWHQAHPRHGKIVTVLLLGASVAVTCYLTWLRHWSVNTFDGAAVGRFDVEAYAKPHIRAQSYLAGMFVAMTLPASKLQQRHIHRPWSTRHVTLLTVAFLAMLIVTFITASGAYARRPCQYSEWPLLDHCGSLWSLTLTTIYTALSRTVWTVGVAMIMHLSLGRYHLVASILSWKCWTPLSHLSFGVYLIHPIVIFVWQLGDREKQVFRMQTFGMDYISVCVVSYVFALLGALFVELPCAALWSHFTRRENKKIGGEREKGCDSGQRSQQDETHPLARRAADNLVHSPSVDAATMNDSVLAHLLSDKRSSASKLPYRYGSYDHR